ncbi:hypothetical protein INT44_001762 [Umbelopsis vinacea]|uniref:Uncharacterized protein n=1 Tax=Umbelopsis vinacea TaxID=44442 RepID=A0A8H7PS98_9FUNG|nr:hypothetical protein INT44_001762 [Umbelopsis vinacea]
MTHHHHHLNHHQISQPPSEAGESVPSDNVSQPVSTYDKIKGTWKEFEGKVEDNPDKYQEGHDIKHPEDRQATPSSA